MKTHFTKVLKVLFSFILSYYSFSLSAQSCDPKWNRVKSNPCANSPIQFEANAPGTITYQWDFGDASTSITRDPVHTFAKAGTYVVVLMANGSGGNCTDTLMITIKDCSGNVTSLKQDMLLIYPNPATDFIYIKQINLGEIIVTDLMGCEVLRLDQFDGKLDVSKLTAGTYFIKYTENDLTFVGRFVKLL